MKSISFEYFKNNSKSNTNSGNRSKKNSSKNVPYKYNNYINKHQKDKADIPIPLKFSNNINNTNIRNNDKKNSSKQVFENNPNKGNLNKNIKTSKEKKKTEEQFPKSKEKFNSQNTKNIVKSLNKESQKMPLPNINKRIINDEDFIANFNFGEVDDEQLMQHVIEQSIKDQMKKNKK